MRRIAMWVLILVAGLALGVAAQERPAEQQSAEAEALAAYM